MYSFWGEIKVNCNSNFCSLLAWEPQQRELTIKEDRDTAFLGENKGRKRRTDEE